MEKHSAASHHYATDIIASYLHQFAHKRSAWAGGFATQRLEGKNSRGDKLYWTEDRSGTTTDPKLALCDGHGHPIIYHDLFATYDYKWNEEKKDNDIKPLTPDGIAEAFAQFAVREKLSFFR